MRSLERAIEDTTFKNMGDNECKTHGSRVLPQELIRNQTLKLITRFNKRSRRFLPVKSKATSTNGPPMVASAKAGALYAGQSYDIAYRVSRATRKLSKISSQQRENGQIFSRNSKLFQ